MTRSTISLLLLLGSLTLSAQDPCPAQSQFFLQANNIRASILNGGSLFWDSSGGQFAPNPGPSPNFGPSTIYAAGLWMGGLDPAGNLKMATVDYRYGGGVHSAGPLDPLSGLLDTNACKNWDHIFTVKGDEISDFLSQLPNLASDPAAAVAQFPHIMGWPAHGNPYFSDVWDFTLPTQALAGFVDTDADNLYNPLAGDYPAVTLQNQAAFVPTEFSWCVFNDVQFNPAVPPLQMEVQLSTWAFNCGNQPVLNNTIFTAHKTIYRGGEPLDSCFIGLWADFDLGCASDDYIGSAPDLDAFYAYNQDAVDGGAGDCGSELVFTGTPPVQSVTFLSRPLDKFIGFNNPSIGNWSAATGDPAQPIEYYRYLTGRWRDGSPITSGGTGYQSGGAPTDHYFPGDPGDPNGWSMCSENLAIGDRRGVGSFRAGDAAPGQPAQLLPGAVNELVAAWTVHFPGTPPCDLGATFDEIAQVRALYDDDFSSVCSPLAAGTLVGGRLMISPNPADQSVTLYFDDQIFRAMALVAADGHPVTVPYHLSNGRLEMEVSGLPMGIYFVQVSTAQGYLTGKFVVLH